MKQIRFGLFIVFVLGFTLLASSQNFIVTGSIKLPQSKNPAVNARITIDSLDIQTKSNDSGYFKLVLPRGRHTLLVSYPNALEQQIDIALSNPIYLHIQLQPKSQVLQSVRVSGRKTNGSGINRLYAIQGTQIYAAKKNEVILPNQFATNTVGNNARQLFAKVPGLNIWESDFAGLQLDVAARGLGPSRTANFNTRQNGYDMSADALGYPESYYLPALQAVEKIEIVRGAASLQYGTQFGGMLNFKIKEAPDTSFQLNVEQGIGSFGLSNTFLSAGGRVKKLDYFVYYQYRRGDGWRDNSGFYSHNAFARIGYQINTKLKIGFEYSHQTYEAQQPGGLTDGVFRDGDITQSLRSRNWFGLDWNLAALTADYEINHTAKLSFKTFGLKSQRNALGNLAQIGITDNPNSKRTLIRDNFSNYGTEVRFIKKYAILNRNAAFATGFRLYNGLTNRLQGNANSSSQPDFTFLHPQDPEEFLYDFPSKNCALFTENLFYINTKLSLTFGARFEYILTEAEGFWKQNRFDFAGNLISSTRYLDESSNARYFPLFGIGSNYQLGKDFSVYSNISQNYRSITFSDLRVVNPNFQLDSSITDESGYNADFGLRGGPIPGLLMDVSVFIMRYNNRIGLYPLPGSTTLFRTNIGNSRHLGLESFVEFDFLEFFTTKTQEWQVALFSNLALTNATYIDSDISSIQDRKVEYVPSVMVRSGLNVKWQNFKLTFQYSYVSSQFSDATNSQFNPNALTGIIPSYQVVDCSADYTYKRFKVSGGINNIMNEAYFTRRAQSYPGPGIIPATPRNAYIAIGATF